MTAPTSKVLPPLFGKSLAQDQRGAIVLMAVFMSAFLVGGLWYAMGVGDAIIYRETIQAGADATAFTGAVYHARGMNIIAMVNITIGAVMAIAAAAAVLMQIASMVISVATTLCDLSKLPPVTFTNSLGEIETIDYGPFDYACDAVQPAKDLMVKLKVVIKFINEQRDDMLVALSSSQKEVARTAPWVGSAQGSAVAAGHAPYVTQGGSGSPSMVPNQVRHGLPTQDEPFDKACERGVVVLPKLISMIVPAVLDPILKNMDIDLANKMPRRVCAGTNGGSRSYDLFDPDDICEEKFQGRDNREKREKCEEDMEDDEENTESVDLPAEIGPDDKSTKGMYTQARNGNDYMQVYSAVRGQEGMLQDSDKGVQAPTWGGAAPAAPGSMYEDLGVAQAEFFYDWTPAAAATDMCWPQWQNCPTTPNWDSYKENTLWNLRWRARLRRYRNPTNVEVNVLNSPIAALDVGYDDGLGAFNGSVGMGPTLLDSKAVANTVGGNAASFIGGGSAVIH